MYVWYAMYGNYYDELHALYLLQYTDLGHFATAVTRLPALDEFALTQHTSSQADICNKPYVHAYAAAEAATHGNGAQLGRTCRTQHHRHQATNVSLVPSQHLWFVPDAQINGA